MMNGTPQCVKTGSIREVHAALLAAGFHVSEYSIRCWVKQGKIPAVYSGKKAYISHDAVVALLTQEAKIPQEDKSNLSGIRKTS